MINKDEAKKKNIKIIDREDKKSEDRNDIIAKLKEILPNVITSDETLNIDALKDVIDIANTTANNKGYELTFAGKGLAKALADIPTDKALKIEKAQSKDFKNTDNVVIRGDNIEVLKLLKQNYYGKIKMIYIDPPYNTKNEDFLYKDNFNIRDEKELVEEFGIGEDTVNFLSNMYGTRTHSGWLSFMYPRLKLARELLTDDGVIFISIDDNEQANLKIICDEIFGENNFIGLISVISTPGGKQSSKNISVVGDYILVYAKSDELLLNGLVLSEKQIKKYNKSDKNGMYLTERLRQHGIAERKEDVPTLHFPIYFNPNTNDIQINQNNDYIEILPILPNGHDGRWIWGKDKIIKDKKFIEIRQVKRNNKLIFDVFFKKYLSDDLTRKASTLWDDRKFRTEVGSKYVTKLFGDRIFSFPKPISLVQQIIQIATNKDDLILDFFAGSGTTADAVMQLNAEDGGSRKFILAQWDEKIDENKSKTAFDFCIENKLEPVISSITIERLNRAGEKIITEKPELKDTLDIGYKVFSLAEKRKFDDNEYGKLVLETYNFSTFDKLYQMMNSSNKPLHLKIEEIEKDKLYKVDNEFYILDTFKTSIEDLKGHQIYLDAYSNISLEEALNLGIIDNENLTIIY